MDELHVPDKSCPEWRTVAFSPSSDTINPKHVGRLYVLAGQDRDCILQVPDRQYQGMLTWGKQAGQGAV